MFRSCLAFLGWTLVAMGGAPPALASDPPSAAEMRLEAAVQSWARDSLARDLRDESGLREVAREHSLLLSAGGGIDDQEFLRQSLSAHGILDPYPYLFFGSALRSELPDIERRLLAALRDCPAGERRLYTHVAAGVVERRKRLGWLRSENVVYVTVMLTQRALSFAALPQEMRPGDRFLFEGEIHAPFREPEVLLTRPDGNTQRLENLALEPQHFRAYVRFDQGDGEYQLEVMGRYDLGPRVLGLCSLHPLPDGREPAQRRWVEAARRGTLEFFPARPREPAPRTESEAEERMVSIVNHDRRRFGLAQLVLDPDLVRMARAHSCDMRDHDFFAHVSPRSGRLADRAEAAGIRYQRLAENIAVNRDVESAELALLRSPGHRLNLLSPQYTRIGIGVAFATDSQGERRMHVTQVFMLPEN